VLKKKISQTLLLIVLIFLINCSYIKNQNNSSNKFNIEMIYIEGGVFEMGDCWDYQDEDALPTHLAQIDPFYLSKYEITVGLYEQYTRKVGIKYKSDRQKDYPLTNINWDEASAYCEYNELRLPSEAEWEFAARSGGKQERYAGTDEIGDEIDKYAVHLAISGERPHSVGTKLPNGLGLYDMSGNAYEWIGAYYAKYQNENNVDYIDPDSTKMRIIRGGCFSTFPIRNYERAAVFSDQRSPRIGFRCARSVNK